MSGLCKDQWLHTVFDRISGLFDNRISGGSLTGMLIPWCLCVQVSVGQQDHAGGQILDHSLHILMTKELLLTDEKVKRSIISMCKQPPKTGTLCRSCHFETTTTPISVSDPYSWNTDPDLAKNLNLDPGRI